MNLRTALAVAVLGSFGTACSSAPDEPSAPVSAGSERLQIRASARSRETLGVVHWGIDRGPAGSSSVRGYDEDDNVVVALDSATRTTFVTESDASGYPHAFKATLRLDGRQFSVEVEARATDHRTIRNDFTGEAGSALALLAADLRDGRPSTSLASLASDVKTADLVNPEQPCIVTCDPAVLTAGNANANAAGACAANDPACAGGVNQAAGAQSAANAQCACPGDNSCNQSVNVLNGPVVGHAQAFVDDACCAVKSADGSAGACGATTRGNHKPRGDLAVDMPASPGGYGQVPSSTEFGDRLAAFALANKAKYRIDYVIWNARADFGSGWEPDEGNGSPTADHRDHVHVSFLP